MKKSFHISDILSISTGRLVSNRRMLGVSEVIEHLIGRSVWTHELPGLAEAAKNAVCDQLQWPKEVKATAEDMKDIPGWLAKLEEKYGSEHVLVPLDKTTDSKK